MRVAPALALAAAAVLALRTATAGDGGAPPPPKPPETTLPAFENPAGDAEVGETCLYLVHSVEGSDKRVKYFEERILARTADLVLVETIWTDETGTKNWMVEGPTSGWRAGAKAFPDELLPGLSWDKAAAKDEVIVVGTEQAPKAVRCTKRVLLEPADPDHPAAPRRKRLVWYSHDVAATGRAKAYPAQDGGERIAISWTKRLTPEECAKLAGHYPTAEEWKRQVETQKAERAAMGEPGMDEPGMGDPGMGDPGMTEPGMDDPGMKEPGMDDPAMGT